MRHFTEQYSFIKEWDSYYTIVSAQAGRILCRRQTILQKFEESRLLRIGSSKAYKIEKDFPAKN
jgi:hypothetical protein